MKGNEENLRNTQDQKSRIRERYKGIDADQLDVIPALPQTNFYEDKNEKRVAVYARVSTDDPRQTSSYELQKNHYQDVVSRHAGWNLIEIYADEGISGTSLQHREAFKRMIHDCEAGKIDLIVTKSVSRFARNVVDCIGYVRELKAMNPPIGVFFETENIYTLNGNSEMSLSFISTLAQEESHNKSEIMNASIEMRFRRGIFLTPPLLGYDLDEDGNLVINEDEAKTIRLIFFMYLYGYTAQQIADTLTELKRPTKKGNTSWYSATVLSILQNERHCGDVLARKTWTPSYLDHKSKKNRQDRNQYRQRNHHDAIISRDDFIAVQRMISNAKYRNKGFLPALKVIPSGFLSGFVVIHPRWAGFSEDDYLKASESISEHSTDLNVTANEGDFDLSQFEVARGQFFDLPNKIVMTISSKSIKVNQECIRQFKPTKVELLIHPLKKCLAMRETSTENRNAIEISRLCNGHRIPKEIGGTAFLPTVFSLLNWDPSLKYRTVGLKKGTDESPVLLFSLGDSELLIPAHQVQESLTQNEDDENSPGEYSLMVNRKQVIAYPSDWATSFGSKYYESKATSINGKTDELVPEAELFSKDTSPNITTQEEIQNNILSIIKEMEDEMPNE